MGVFFWHHMPLKNKDFFRGLAQIGTLNPSGDAMGRSKFAISRGVFARINYRTCRGRPPHPSSDAVDRARLLASNSRKHDLSSVQLIALR